MNLFQLKNTHRKKKRSKRLGRGPGSKRGKTCCRGHKGDKSRSGYKTRAGKEGGQLPLYQKLPHRGFSNKRFQKPLFSINLNRIEQFFEEGEVVNQEALLKRGISMRHLKKGIKILSNGELTKKVVIEAKAFSKNAIRKLEKKGIEFKRV